MYILMYVYKLFLSELISTLSQIEQSEELMTEDLYSKEDTVRVVAMGNKDSPLLPFPISLLWIYSQPTIDRARIHR